MRQYILLLTCMVLGLFSNTSNAQCGRVSYGCGSYSDYSGCGYSGYSGCGAVYDSCGNCNAEDENPVPVRKVKGKPANPTPIEIEPIPAPAIERARIRMRVPEDAKVFVNNRPTTSTGSVRNYGFDGDPKKRYRFNIEVQVVRNGELLAENKTILIKGQQLAELTFDPQVSAAATLSTSEPRPNALSLRR